VKNYVKHYRVAEDEADGTWTALGDFPGEFPAHRFATFIKYKPERRVNWQATFAQRGLNHIHYRETSSSETTCTFSCAEEFQSLGPAMVTVSLQGENPEAILQGDTVTYVEHVAGLYLESFHRIENCLSMRFVRREVSLDMGVFYLTGEYPKEINPRAFDRYRSGVADIWNTERSVLAVCVQ